MSTKVRSFVIWLLWIVLWWLLAVAVDNKILLAGPAETLEALISLVGAGKFYRTLLSSLLRIGVGFLFGIITGVIFASVSHKYTWLEAFLAPFVNLLKAIPVASFVVLLLIWWGSSLLAVAISLLVVFPNIYISTLEGLKNADVRLLEMAEVFGVSGFSRFFYIYRPALKPFLYSGLKISLGMCWKSGVAAEVIGTPAYSIGERLYLSKIYLDTADLFAWTTVMILLCMIFEKLVFRMAEKFFAWEPVCGKAGNSVKAVNAAGEIRMVNVAKAYNGQRALKQITAEYHSGETYYLTSPSGSGKTTLLRILAGLTQADSGEIQVWGQGSMLFQEDRLCEDYDAVKNVELVTGSKERAREELLELLPSEALCKPCRMLSGGQRRRVALVRAMVAESDFLLLDEPFTGMDKGTRQCAEAYIRSRQRGRTLIIATHI